MIPFTKKPTIKILDRAWHPVQIQPDNDELAERERVMVRFSHFSEPEFFIAPPGTMYAGWVVGTAL